MSSWRTLDEFASPSEPGGERDVVARVLHAVAAAAPDPRRRATGSAPPWPRR